ncbi:MAG TPA: alpha/beta hydrolase [Bacteriovoracaceae bacterium]|nr:alpha/beta hydrolase [Bacteriovoracaceae bacterium]
MLKSLVLLLLLPTIAAAAPYLEWFNSSAQQTAGQSLLIHGLNTKPEKLADLIREVNLRGHDVLLLRLKGHNDDLLEMKKITQQAWLEQLAEAFFLLRARNEARKGSLTLLAHSLGGVLATTYLAAHPEYRMDQLLLFAPALEVNFTSQFIRALYVLPDGYLVPSMAPESYQAQRGTSIAAYRALFQTISDFRALEPEKLNFKTTVLMDPKDELVSFSGLETLMKKLNRWKLVAVSTAGSTLPRPYHHLIISRESLGSEDWEQKVLTSLDEMLGKPKSL